MKVKINAYCQEKIEGRLLILDGQRILDVSEGDGRNLINKNLAIEIIELDESNHGISPQSLSPDSSNSFENKMIDVVYKKRGRPRKEVKDGNI